MRETKHVIRTLVHPENYGAVGLVVFVVRSLARPFIRSFAQFVRPFIRSFICPQPGFIPRNYHDKGPP